MPRSPRIAGLLVLAAAAGPAQAASVEALQACAGVADGAARLACFDGLAAALAGPSFEGFGSGETPVFETQGAATLVYENDDAVLVLYLLTEGGELVRNLHLGGRGSARHPLPGPGRYRVEADATGGWRIRVEKTRPGIGTAP